MRCFTAASVEAGRACAAPGPRSCLVAGDARRAQPSETRGGSRCRARSGSLRRRRTSRSRSTSCGPSLDSSLFAQRDAAAMVRGPSHLAHLWAVPWRAVRLQSPWPLRDGRGSRRAKSPPASSATSEEDARPPGEASARKAGRSVFQARRARLQATWSSWPTPTSPGALFAGSRRPASHAWPTRTACSRRRAGPRRAHRAGGRADREGARRAYAQRKAEERLPGRAPPGRAAEPEARARSRRPDPGWTAPLLTSRRLLRWSGAAPARTTG